MPTSRHAVTVAVVFVLCTSAVAAQGTAADYLRADSLGARYQGTIVNSVNQTNWIGRTSWVWYRKTTGTGTAYMLVDAASKAKQAAFDQARLAAALSTALKRPVSADSLPLDALQFSDARDAITFSPDSTRWRCTVPEYKCEEAPNTAQRFQGRDFGGGLYGDLPSDNVAPRNSPDGNWEASIRNYNIYIRPLKGSASAGWFLSTDGMENNAYAMRSIQWSPDSRRVVAYRVKPGYRREVHYVMSSPEDQLQPKHSTRLYNKPGDVLDVEQPVLFTIDTKQRIDIDNALFPNAYDMTPLSWRKDSRAVTFEYNQRGHQVYRVIEIDAATGKTRAVIDEQSPTFFEYSGKKYRFDLADGKEVIWASERDGWNHLYLYDGTTGKVIRQITKGPWLVRGVDKVDTVAKQIWFNASGTEAGGRGTEEGKRDPYFVQYYRINFDGTGLIAMTEADAMHNVSYSADMRYFVDIYSRVDLPPVFELRRTDDRALVMELERADASKLAALKWKAPEVFVAKGRDGKTDIWGVIIRPTNFDPSRKYPVIENIYAGPHGSFVPKTFSTQLGMQRIAELGFIVVQIDGMGTSNRSKAFHDVAWKNLGDAGFPDRILWHKAVAAKYPYYDISRVGIYGTSAGGQSSMGALLFHPEFYKVAVSAAGCHDNRMDKIWWNEQWMGWPIGPEYGAASNVDNAYRLQGKLLLIVGEMDRNVDPSSTMQVVNALIKAKKSFDLLVIPGADHTSGGEYGDRKRWDFFVHHLLHVEPPDRNATAVTVAGSPK